MTLAQSRVAALLDIAIWPAKTPNQEVAQPFFGTGHVVSGVHRAKNVVARDLGIKRPHEARKPVLANLFKNLKFANLHAAVRNHKMSSEAIFMKIASELIFTGG